MAAGTRTSSCGCSTAARSGGQFTVVEDDGTSRSAPPREIGVVQRHDGEDVVVEVAAAGTVTGLADVRPLRVELVSTVEVAGVRVNGLALPQLLTPSRDEAGWAVGPDLRSVYACVPDAPVAAAHTFRFTTAGPLPAMSSVLLVCDHADTVWGEDVWARFVTPVQTAYGPLGEVRLDPSATYPYLYPPPAGHPTGPIWTLLLDHLAPNQEVRFTVEKRRGDTVVHANPRQLFRDGGQGGYVGEIRGSL